MVRTENHHYNITTRTEKERWPRSVPGRSQWQPGQQWILHVNTSPSPPLIHKLLSPKSQRLPPAVPHLQIYVNRLLGSAVF